MSRYDLTDFEWRVIEPLLPNKPRGVPRVDDRRVLNGIFWVLRSGAPWRDLPERYGPRTTCYNRFVRWRKAGVIANAVAEHPSINDFHAPIVVANDSETLVIDHSFIALDSLGACHGMWIGVQKGPR